MNDELTVFIVKELSKHRTHNDIVKKVCERGGLNWKQASQLVTLIEAKYRRTITVQQAPRLLFLSIGILILGICLLAFNLQILLSFFQKDVFQQILSVQSSAYRVIGLVTGFGMTVGGLIGLWKSFGTMFPE